MNKFKSIFRYKYPFIPFASNGCGDLICWKITKNNEIVFWDHETDTYKVESEDFINWLSEIKE